MDKLTMQAFRKMEKRENLLRRARNRRALGRITQEEFRKQEAEIIRKFQLTDEEQRAYERYAVIAKQRRRM